MLTGQLQKAMITVSSRYHTRLVFKKTIITTSRILMSTAVDSSHHSDLRFQFATEDDSLRLTKTIESLLQSKRINEAAYALNNRIVGSEVDNVVTRALLSQCVCHCLWDDAISVVVYMVRKGHKVDYYEFEYALAAMLTSVQRVNSFVRILKFIVLERRNDLADIVNMTKVHIVSLTFIVFHEFCAIISQ